MPQISHHVWSSLHVMLLGYPDNGMVGLGVPLYEWGYLIMVV